MKFRDLKKYISEKPSDKVYLIEGDDAYFREKARNMLIEYIVTAYPEINSAVLQQPSVTLIAQSMSVLPFLSERRAVIIYDYYPAPYEIDKLVSSGFEEGEQSVLLILNSRKHLSYNKISAKLCRIDCSKEEPSVLKVWIKSMFKAYGKNIDLVAAEQLAVFCGQDMMRIDGEIKKLAHIEKAVISSDDIENNVSKDTDYQAYMLSSAAAEKKGGAYGIIKDFLSKGDAGSSIILLMSLYSSFKRMFYVKDSNLSKEKLAEMLGVKPYAVTMSGRAAARFSKKELYNILKMLSDCDYNIKSGKMGGETALYYVTARLLKDCYEQ